MLDKILESSLDNKKIKAVNSEGNQHWIFIGSADAEAEAPAPILWPPDAKSQLIRKDPDAGKDWRQEEKGTTEAEMGWMASLTQWTWVWASSGRWWRTEEPGELQSMGSQRIRHDLGTQQQQQQQERVPVYTHFLWVWPGFSPSCSFPPQPACLMVTYAPAPL